jgi:hypothetical protein
MVGGFVRVRVRTINDERSGLDQVRLNETTLHGTPWGSLNFQGGPLELELTA